MQIIREAENYIPRGGPLFLALGNFDGVHRGHQKLIASLLEQARLGQGTGAAFIFEPHPSKILFAERAPKMLVSAGQKAELLRQMGMDLLIYHTFTEDMARWDPEVFVQKILVDRLQIAEAFVGFNYSFGHKGAGTPETLKELGSVYGFKVHIVSPVTVAGEIASSSLIRRYLDEGAIEQAYDMLGYHPFIEGQVVKGDRRGGALLGFPTANLQVEADAMIPGKGVYAVKARTLGQEYLAVVNIGNVPTFLSGESISIEAHLLNFDQDLYGQEMTLSLYKKLRDEKKFNGVEELKAQIAADCATALEYLQNSSL